MKLIILLVCVYVFRQRAPGIHSCFSADESAGCKILIGQYNILYHYFVAHGLVNEDSFMLIMFNKFSRYSKVSALS